MSMLETLRPLFRPKAVAVYGASRSGDKHGNRVMRYVLKAGFAGAIYPINPAGGEIEGLPSYASIASVPGPVDCALFVIPAAGTVKALRECAAAGVRGAVIASTGFSELGNEEGRAREAEITAIARETGLRIVGPNTNGLYNATDCFPLGYNTSHGDPLTPGPISIAAHSGALFNGLLPRLRKLGAGLSKFVAVGNEADLTILDLLEYYIEDPDTRVIGMIVEGLKDGRRFRALADRAREAGKPIVALKLGRSEAGAGATIAHSTRLAGSARAYDAVFAQHGVATVPTVEALAGGCAVLLARGAQASRSPRLICIATTGGGASLLADHAERYRMPLAGEEGGAWGGKVAALMAQYGDTAVVRNPTDTSALAGHDRLTAFFQAQEADGFDGPMAIYTHMLPNVSLSKLIAAQLIERRKRTGSPSVVVVPGGLNEELEQGYRDAGMPLFYDTATAFDSLSCHYQTLERDGSDPSVMAGPALPDIAPLLSQTAQRVLSELESAKVLRAAGVPIVESRVVASIQEARSAADAIGYPVVLKALAPGVAHKNRLGLVQARLADGKALAAAYAKLENLIEANAFKRSDVPFILQPMTASAAELIVGVSWEPPFGHCLVVGLGGIYTEALDESLLFAVPVSANAMRRALAATRLGRLLEAMKVTEAVLLALAALQSLVLAHGTRIESVDVNPLLARENGGVVAVDALVVLKASPEPNKV